MVLWKQFKTSGGVRVIFETSGGFVKKPKTWGCVRVNNSLKDTFFHCNQCLLLVFMRGVNIFELPITTSLYITVLINCLYVFSLREKKYGKRWVFLSFIREVEGGEFYIGLPQNCLIRELNWMHLKLGREFRSLFQCGTTPCAQRWLTYVIRWFHNW